MRQFRCQYIHLQQELRNHIIQLNTRTLCKAKQVILHAGGKIGRPAYTWTPSHRSLDPSTLFPDSVSGTAGCLLEWAPSVPTYPGYANGGCPVLRTYKSKVQKARGIKETIQWLWLLFWTFAFVLCWMRWVHVMDGSAEWLQRKAAAAWMDSVGSGRCPRGGTHRCTPRVHE